MAKDVLGIQKLAQQVQTEAQAYAQHEADYKSAAGLSPTDKLGFYSSFGSISSFFGGTNLDNIPSSGGTKGYTTDQGPGLRPSAPTPVKILPTDNYSFGDTSGSTSGVNSTQSGDLSNDALDKLIALFGSNFQAPSDASTSGGGVVVVPQASSDSTAAPATSAVSPQLLALLALGVVGFFVYRHFHKAG